MTASSYFRLRTSDFWLLASDFVPRTSDFIPPYTQGEASNNAIVAQVLPAAEMNSLSPWGKPLST